MRRASFLSSPCRCASLRRRICLPAGRDPETGGPQQLQSLCAYAVTDQTKDSILLRPYAVLCCVLQCSARGVPRCGGAHPAFSPAKLKLPH